MVLACGQVVLTSTSVGDIPWLLIDALLYGPSPIWRSAVFWGLQSVMWGSLNPLAEECGGWVGSDRAINKGVETGLFNFNPSWSEFGLCPSCLFC